MSEQASDPIGDVCWLEIAATDMARCQSFYKTVFGWEFAAPPPMPGMPEGAYAMFSKPGTKLAGGLHLVKEENLLKPEVNEQGRGQSTNKIIIRVEEVEESLKAVEAAGGKITSGKWEIGPDMGFVGGFRDTEGNINGVWSKK